MSQIFNNKFVLKGFTLIEMIVVIAVLGILATIVLISINPIAQLQKSNDARRKTDLESIQRALELYYQDNGTYPISTGDKIKGINWGSAWQPYIATLPSDPLPANRYVYYSPNNQTYYLYANLQRGKYDQQICNNGNACVSVGANGLPLTACGGTCNYGISSSNVSP